MFSTRSRSGKLVPRNREQNNDMLRDFVSNRLKTSTLCPYAARYSSLAPATLHLLTPTPRAERRVTPPQCFQEHRAVP